MRLGELRHMSGVEIQSEISRLVKEIEKLTDELRMCKKVYRHGNNQLNRDLNIFDMRESGESFTDIAVKVGVSKSRVRGIYLRIKRQKTRDANLGLPSRYD